MRTWQGTTGDTFMFRRSALNVKQRGRTCTRTRQLALLFRYAPALPADERDVIGDSRAKASVRDDRGPPVAAVPAAD